MESYVQKPKTRLIWVNFFLKTGSISIASIRCGIARSTMCRWVNRYKSGTLEELSDKSHRPKTSKNQNVTPEIEALILSIRSTKKWGAQRISTF